MSSNQSAWLNVMRTLFILLSQRCGCYTSLGISELWQSYYLRRVSLTIYSIYDLLLFFFRGICEVNRHILSCPDVKSFEEGADKLKGFSPCHKTNDHAKWPEKPKTLTYQKIHKYSEVAPWCTYALEYSISVGVSS